MTSNIALSTIRCYGVIINISISRYPAAGTGLELTEFSALEIIMKKKSFKKYCKFYTHNKNQSITWLKFCFGLQPLIHRNQYPSQKARKGRKPKWHPMVLKAAKNLAHV